MTSRILITFLLAMCAASCSRTPPPELLKAPDGEWIAAFNGKDLNDWTVKIAGHDVGENFGNTYRVENGLLKVGYEGYGDFGRQFGSLFYNRKLSRYWIRAEYRFAGKQAKGAPSWAYKDGGIQLHSQPASSMRRDQEFPVSVELNLLGAPRFGSRPTGDVCRNGTILNIQGVPLQEKCSASSSVAAPRNDDDWTIIEAEVRGSQRIRHAVNGMLVTDYSDIAFDESDADARALAVAAGSTVLEAGYVSIQSNSHPIEFRRIDILPLEDK